jgi:hypothetical protein
MYDVSEVFLGISKSSYRSPLRHHHTSVASPATNAEPVEPGSACGWSMTALLLVRSRASSDLGLWRRTPWRRVLVICRRRRLLDVHGRGQPRPGATLPHLFLEHAVAEERVLVLILNGTPGWTRSRLAYAQTADKEGNGKPVRMLRSLGRTRKKRRKLSAFNKEIP